jgi:hypothetical protein
MLRGDEMRRVTLSLPNELADRMQKHCYLNGQTLSGWVRSSMQKELGDKTDAEEV